MDRKINSNLIWNYISFIIMAISGLTMNSLIAIHYGSETLGVFSETYAWYLVLSQLSVCGIHMAIVKQVPEKENESDKGDILITGVITVAFISLAIEAIAELLLLATDVAWTGSMQVAFLGIVLLSINRVLLNYLNAIYKMKAFALFTSIRYACIGIIIVSFCYLDVNLMLLAAVFPITEVIVLISITVYFKTRNLIHGKFKKECFISLLAFGTKLIPSYMVLELNTKVDVICLGVMTSDISKIGIYSFAIFFTEGFYQLYITLRRIINPMISKENARNNLVNWIKNAIRDLRKYYLFGGFMAFIGIIVAYIVICELMGRHEYINGIIYIIIICGSIFLNGKYVIFGDLLAQSGLPLEESKLNMITVLCNVLLNILFIVMFGVVGAAIATAISHFVFTLFLRNRSINKLGVYI